jgi:hypothetical protein
MALKQVGVHALPKRLTNSAAPWPDIDATARTFFTTNWCRSSMHAVHTVTVTMGAKVLTKPQVHLRTTTNFFWGEYVTWALITHSLCVAAQTT